MLLLLLSLLTLSLPLTIITLRSSYSASFSFTLSPLSPSLIFQYIILSIHTFPLSYLPYSHISSTNIFLLHSYYFLYLLLFTHLPLFCRFHHSSCAVSLSSFCVSSILLPFSSFINLYYFCHYSTSFFLSILPYVESINYSSYFFVCVISFASLLPLYLYFIYLF